MKQEEAEAHYARVFGPFVAGAYAVGDVVTFDRGRAQGTIAWSFVDEAEGDRPDRFAYAVVVPGNELPMEVEPGDICE